jgi:5-methylcytosine-specific restriction endonuclease McrA
VRKVCDILRSVTGNTFCSPACWHAHAQEENHPRWEGGQHERVCPEYRRWRRAVLKRDGRACRLCGSTQRLQAHHIKKFAKHPECRWEVANGIILCLACHDTVRGKEEQYEAALKALT